MKLIAALLTAGLALAVAAPVFAADDSPAARRRAKRTEQRPAERSSTVARDGTCQRDNGRPLDSLKLNHDCDRREFWDRMNERGNDRN